jgi:glutamyl-tRNA synthetase
LCRDLEIKEHLLRWERMLDKKGYKKGEVVLRFKSDLSDSNPALRDFPLARINDANHPRQGKKYRVWPLMNLSVFVDDLDYGVTHAIRAKEHQDNAKRQEMMFRVFGKTPPKSYFLGRLKFTDLEISCSKTKERIDAGEFSGWDDIRLPFMTALKKRGFQREAFVKMTEQRGLSDVDKVLTKDEYFELLASFNREFIREKVREIEFSEEKKKGLIKIKLLMPDNKERDIFIECEEKMNDGDLVYFKKLGYARFNLEENCFWFCHN